MAEFCQLLAAVLRIAICPLVGYCVLRLGRRWPRATVILLLSFIAIGSGAVGYAKGNGFRVDPGTRKMEFGSETGRRCFGIGAALLVLGIPSLPLVAIARSQSGASIGPTRAGEWLVVLFGHFMACAIFSMVLYSWLTGIVK